MLLIPVGLDEARLSRLPWISIAIAALCGLVWVATLVGGTGAEVETRYRELIGYWSQHPYLEAPAELDRIMGNRAALIRAAAEAVPRPTSVFEELEQRELSSKVAAFLEAYDAQPERRWALVPARGLWQPGWLSHIFLHGSFGHILGNMLVFLLVVGPFLEDAWGRPFFLGLFLAGGVVAGAAQALPMADSEVAVIGASGAISACLGAFALRFAHRRVRIFYWFFLFVRGTFFVPVWLYALIGAALDLLGLQLGGMDAPVAYAAHLGGFAFGLLVAYGVRSSGLEARIAPEGSAPWAGSIGVARAAEAISSGWTSRGRSLLRQQLAAHPDDEEALLHLARLEASRLEVQATHEPLERLLARRLAAADPGPARELLEEFQQILRPDMLRPATAYRAGEVLERTDRVRALAFLGAAGMGSGAVGAKALLRAAGLLRDADPDRAMELARQAAARDDAPAELRQRAERMAAGQWEEPAARTPVVRRAAVAVPAGIPTAIPTTTATATPSPSPTATPTPTSTATPSPTSVPPSVRLVGCRLVGAGPGGMELMTDDGRAARLAPGQVERVAVGLLARDPSGGAKNALVVDLVLRREPGQGRVIVRIPGRGLALQAIRPGLPATEAFASWMAEVLAASGALPLPSAEAAHGRPFTRFADLQAFEEACHGRGLGG